MTDLFDPADFESIELALYFQNLSTERIVEDLSKVSIIEIGEKHVVLGLPAWGCDPGNHILLKVYKVVKPSLEHKPLFNTTAKVEAVQAADEGMIMAKLDLIQFDKKGLADFIEVFSKRQEEISNYLMQGKK